MRVNDFESVDADFPRQPTCQSKVEPWTTVQRDHRHTLALHPLTKLTDVVEAEDHRRDAGAQSPDRLGHEHLGTSHLHDVQNEADPQCVRVELSVH